MFINVMGRLASEKPETRSITSSTGQPLKILTCQLAVNRGGSKRMDLLTGQEQDADFFELTFFGAQADSFEKNYAKGRQVFISGTLLINEFVTKKESPVFIGASNPLFATAQSLGAQVITDTTGNPMAVISANMIVRKPVITANAYQWGDANPNKAVTPTGFAASVSAAVNSPVLGANLPPIPAPAVPTAAPAVTPNISAAMPVMNATPAMPPTGFVTIPNVTTPDTPF